MAKRLEGIDSEEAMGILDESREWFVFHMMRTAERNNRQMEGVLGEFEKKLEFLASNEQTECPVCLEAFERLRLRGRRRCSPAATGAARRTGPTG